MIRTGGLFLNKWPITGVPVLRKHGEETLSKSGDAETKTALMGVMGENSIPGALHTRDAKLLYAVLLGYAWQEQRCFPGYQRLCADLEASENAIRKWMRELEDAQLISQRRARAEPTCVSSMI